MTKPNDTEKQAAAEEAFREADAGDGTTREDQILHGAKLVACVSSLMLLTFTGAMDQTITASALTTIADHFHAFSQMTWITAAYMLPTGALAQVWARLSISFGRKPVIILGFIVFEIGSLIAALSQNMAMFIGSRAIQGIAVSCIQTCVVVVCTEITSIRYKPIVFSIFSITFIVASAVGPIIGGSLTTYASWRWCFYLNLIMGAVSLPAFMLSYKPKTPKGTFKEKLMGVDYVSSFLMATSICLLLLGLSFGQSGTTYRSASVICCFTIGGLLLVAFFVTNHYSKYPTIPEDILLNFSIFMDFVTLGFNFSSYIVTLQYLSIYFQNIAEHDAFHTGTSIIPLALSSGLVSLITGILIKLTRHLKLYSLISGLLVPTGTGVLMLFTTKENLGLSIGLQILIGAGVGMNGQAPFMNSMLEAPKTAGSSIMDTAYISSARCILPALFSELAGSIYTATLKSQLPEVVSQLQETDYPIEEVIQQVQVLKELNAHDQAILKVAILKSLKATFWLSLALSVVSLVAAALMSNKRMPKDVADDKPKEDLADPSPTAKNAAVPACASPACASPAPAEHAAPKEPTKNAD